MIATLVILLLWLGFGATHIGLSSMTVRRRLVDGIGENAFRGLYSLIAFVFFIPLVWFYFTHKHEGPWLWMLPRGMALLVAMYIGMAIAFTLLAASLVRPSPASFIPGDPTPRGVFRLARHPLFMALALFGLLHILPNSTTGDVVFFGGFTAFALGGAWHQDQRKLQAAPVTYGQFCRGTPFIPFTGSATLQGIRELSLPIIVAGILTTIVVRYFHSSWFGG